LTSCSTLFPVIKDRAVTEGWAGDASQVEGSLDLIIGLDRQPFGIELSEIRGIDDPRDYVDEAYRLGSQKSDSYVRRGIFRFPIALIMYSNGRLCSTFATVLRQRPFRRISRLWVSMKSGPSTSMTPIAALEIRAGWRTCSASSRAGRREGYGTRTNDPDPHPSTGGLPGSV
jgi:hypothetical protein